MLATATAAAAMPTTCFFGALRKVAIASGDDAAYIVEFRIVPVFRPVGKELFRKRRSAFSRVWLCVVSAGD